MDSDSMNSDDDGGLFLRLHSRNSDEENENSDDGQRIINLLQLLRSSHSGRGGRSASQRRSQRSGQPHVSREFSSSQLRHWVQRLLLQQQPGHCGVVAAPAASADSSATSTTQSAASAAPGSSSPPPSSSCFNFASCAGGQRKPAAPTGTAAQPPASAAKASAKASANGAGGVVSVSRLLGNRAGASAKERYHLVHCRLPNSSRVLLKSRSYFFCGVFSDPGDIFMCASQGDNSPIRIFDTRDGMFTKIKTVTARDVGWSVLDLSLSPTGHHMVYSSWSHCLQLVGIHSDLHEPLSLLGCHADHLHETYNRGMFCHRWSSCGDLLIVGCNNGSLCLYDMHLRQPQWFHNCHGNDVNTVAWAENQNDRLLLSSGDDGVTKLWDLRCLQEGRPRPVSRFAGHRSGVVYVDSRRDGRHFLSNSKDQTIKVFDLRRPASANFVADCLREVQRNVFDYRYQTVPLFKTEPMDGDPSLLTLTGHVVSRTLLRAKFSPQFTTGQRYVYGGSADGSLLFWDTLTGAVLNRIADLHSSVPIRDVSWHPHDCQRLHTAGWDMRIRCCSHRRRNDSE